MIDVVRMAVRPAAAPDAATSARERGLDIMRNATVNVGDRIKEFSYKTSGGRIAKRFDGSEKVLSIDAIHWSHRATSAP
jgi:hypothetical protein